LRCRLRFDDFRSDIENIAHKDLLVIPGNHDVRKKGNAFFNWGRNSEYISDLQWSPVVFDDELQMTFISFNSSATGNFAKGTVPEAQRRDRGTRLDKELRKRPQVANYIKVALVHHHPYAYGSQPTALYEKLMAELLGGDEKFIAFEGSQDFMQGCATRGVSLVLHGHKHIPHFVTVHLSSHGKTQEITVVGCGSSTGVDGKPMCYDIITMDPLTRKWNVLFYHDPKGDGSGFSLQNVALDVRPTGTHHRTDRLENLAPASEAGQSARHTDNGDEVTMVDIGVEAEMTDENTGSLVPFLGADFKPTSKDIQKPPTSLSGAI
jgi:3',5'-cyclic AMP phosphodiesterase CpdA